MTVSIASSMVAPEASETIAMRGTMTSWMRWSPSSMTAWIICSSSASRMPCSPPCSMIRRSSSALIRSSAATSAPNSRLIRRVVQRQEADERPEQHARAHRSAGSVDIATRSAWARPICFGTSSPKMIVKIVSTPVTTISAMPPAMPCERPEALQPRLEPVDEADRGERRGEEAEEVDPDLDDREEAARLLLEALDAAALLVALVDELLEAAAADRDERDLGRREDAVEQDQDDDDPELDEGAAQAGPPSRRLSAPDRLGARGSRMRAGTPTASLPGGTSRVTTAPAPVRAPSPISRGATIIVSTPMNAPSPIVVRCLAVPS